jgi:hypothetical protein
MTGLFSYVSSLRQRARALLHRNDQLKVDSAERRDRWNEVIAEHQKPLDPQKSAGKINLPGS